VDEVWVQLCPFHEAHSLSLLFHSFERVPHNIDKHVQEDYIREEGSEDKDPVGQRRILIVVLFHAVIANTQRPHHNKCVEYFVARSLRNQGGVVGALRMQRVVVLVQNHDHGGERDYDHNVEAEEQL